MTCSRGLFYSDLRQSLRTPSGRVLPHASRESRGIGPPRNTPQARKIESQNTSVSVRIDSYVAGLTLPYAACRLEAQAVRVVVYEYTQQCRVTPLFMLLAACSTYPRSPASMYVRKACLPRGLA